MSWRSKTRVGGQRLGPSADRDILFSGEIYVVVHSQYKPVDDVMNRPTTSPKPTTALLSGEKDRPTRLVFPTGLCERSISVEVKYVCLSGPRVMSSTCVLQTLFSDLWCWSSLGQSAPAFMDGCKLCI